MITTIYTKEIFYDNRISRSAMYNTNVPLLLICILTAIRYYIYIKGEY